MVSLHLSDEQAMLRDSIGRFADAEAASSPERQLRGLAELGLFALSLPSGAGGMEGKGDDVMVMMEAVGRGLLGAPAVGFHAAADFIGRHGAGRQRETWLAPVAEGRLRIAFAEADAIAFDGGRLSGRVDLVNCGGMAEAILLASPAGAFLLDAAASGMQTEAFRIVDGTIAARLTLGGAPAEALDATPDQIEDGISRARVAASAAMLGTMERLLADTLAHVKTRRQFGAAIGSFQTIQHRMARLYVSTGQCRSLVMAAALGETGGRRDWLRSVAAAQALVGERAIELAHECVQFHGGMGITEDLAVSRGHRQLVVLSRLFGSAAEARRAFDALG